MRRDFIFVGILGVVLTIVGEVLAITFDIFPFVASEEGQLIDNAFEILLIVAIPVFTFVVVVLLYSVLRFRVRGEEEEPRPSFYRTNAIFSGWVVITTVIALAVLIYPGIVGMNELRADNFAELEVQVVAEKWDWTFIYPEYDITIEEADEFVLPADTRVRFEITSKDILHSFWVPAFRMKTDAVPGRVNTMFVTTTETGSFAEDANVRVQCAELCGTGHARMRTGLVIMETGEFQDWIIDMQSVTQ
jgi:cytochrome c oxidase subunit 2